MEQFDRHLGQWMELPRTDSGIQLVGLFRNKCDDRKIAARAAKNNVNVSPLSMQFRHRTPLKGLLFGFAAADEKTTKLAMQRLEHILSEEAKT